MIRNLLFDFGNVLFDLDLAAFEREMKTLLGAGFSTTREKLVGEPVFELYETGGMSSEEFVERVCAATAQIPTKFAKPGRFESQGITPEQAIAAWNSIFIGMPHHRFEMLLRLRQHYKVFLLSNINEMHEHWIADYMLREHGIADYESRYFDGVYFSHLIRLRKPEREAFEYVLADAEILPEETVFFDDLPENVEAAKRAGIQGVWHEPGTEIGERLVGMKILPTM